MTDDAYENQIKRIGLHERIMRLATSKRKTIVYISVAQCHDIRNTMTIQQWLEYVRDAEKMEDADPRDVARIGNALIRYKEVPDADPAEVDLTEEE